VDTKHISLNGFEAKLRSIFNRLNIGRGVRDFGLKIPVLFSVSLFFFVVAMAPIPYGSRNASTVSIWCILLGAALAASPLRNLGKPQRLFSLGIIFCLCCVGFVLHEQLSKSPWIASPNPLWATASEALGQPLQPLVSIVANEPFFALGPPLAALLALWLGVILGVNRHVARRLLWIVALLGAGNAVYGILSTLIEPNMLLFREREAYVGYVTGTFVNRNTAAAFFGCCAAIWLLLLIDSARALLPYKFSARTRWVHFGAVANSRNVRLIAIALFICLLALFMTGSRAGIMLSLATLVLPVTVYVGLDQPRRKGIFFSLAISIGVIACLYLLLGGALNSHFNMQGFDGEGRFSTYRSTLQLIAANPLFGSGLGTFAWAFPAYRSSDASAWGIWNVAHSTPLELAADLGIPLAMLIAAAWITILYFLARGIFIRRRDTIIPFAGLCVALIGLLHSAIDFSLQVPGFAIVAMAIVGVGIAQAFPSQKRRDDRN
jgi:hypothetical protein